MEKKIEQQTIVSCHLNKMTATHPRADVTTGKQHSLLEATFTQVCPQEPCLGILASSEIAQKTLRLLREIGPGSQL